MRNNRFVITGPPGCGKTPVLKELVALGFRGVAEPAREVLAEQRAVGGNGVPERDPTLFCDLMLARAIEDFERSNDVDTVVFFDRGIPDMVGYVRLFGLDASAAERAAAAYRYNDLVFVMPGWPEIYTTDDERTMSFEVADAFGKMIRDVYMGLGYTLVEVPRDTPTARARFIEEVVSRSERKGKGDVLPGGAVTSVVRVGETVRRRMGDRADFVHRLLSLFEEQQWTGASRFLGIDDEGRETLNFIPGHVAWEDDQPVSVGSEDSLRIVGRLVREFHDLTAGSDLAQGDEVVCHNDLSPRNTVYQDRGDGLRPVAFIDWDIAAPGKRIHDVAHMCWQYVGLGPRYQHVADAGRRIRLLCDAYGLEDRRDVVETILWWQDRCWRGMEAQAEAGVEAMVRLRDKGAVADVRACYDWVLQNRAALEEAIR